MKKFDQLTPEQKKAALDRALLNSVRRIYNGGLTTDPGVRKDLQELVKDAEQKYFDDNSGGSFCGCSTCLEYLVKAIKTSRFGQVKELVITDAQKTVDNTYFLEPGDRSETL